MQGQADRAGNVLEGCRLRSQRKLRRSVRLRVWERLFRRRQTRLLSIRDLICDNQRAKKLTQIVGASSATQVCMTNPTGKARGAGTGDGGGGGGLAVVTLAVAMAMAAGCETAPTSPSTSSFPQVQGQLFQTQSANDLALDGPGLYMVGEGGDRAYVRGGRFHIDERSALIDAQGRALQGRLVNAVSSSPRTILLWPWASQPAPQPTSQIAVEGNLDADSVIATQPFDVDRPGTTSTFSTSVDVFDVNGTKHAISLYFRATGMGTWRWYAVLSPNRGCDPGANNVVGGSGAMTFNEAGTMSSATATDAEWSFQGAALPQRINLTFHPGLRQDHGPSGTTRISQDGHGASARLADLRPDGTLRILDGSNELLTVASVPIILFANFAGLAMESPGVFRETAVSGPPLDGPAGQGGRGLAMSGFLESLN